MKRLGTKHTNTQPLKQSNAISSPKEPFYKIRVGQQRHQWKSTPAVEWWWSPDVATTPRYIISLCEGVLFACLGCERRTLAASKFLPEKRRSKTNRTVCIQIEAEPQNHSLACGSHHSVPTLTSPKTNTLKIHQPQPEGEESEKKCRFELH